MKYLNNTVAYLQDKDFDSSGVLINPNIPTDIPVLIMIQTGFCGYCSQAKPSFQEFANKHFGKVFSATIQADGKEEGEQELGKRLNIIKPDFRGYPDYVLYYNNKRVDKNDIKGRSVKDLEDFVWN